MIRFRAEIAIDAPESDLTYHGETLNETVLVYVLKEIIYNHTNVYDSQITVTAERLANASTDATE